MTSLEEQVKAAFDAKEEETLNSALTNHLSKDYMDGIVDGFELAKNLVLSLINEKVRELQGIRPRNNNSLRWAINAAYDDALALLISPQKKEDSQ